PPDPYNPAQDKASLVARSLRESSSMDWLSEWEPGAYMGIEQVHRGSHRDRVRSSLCRPQLSRPVAEGRGDRRAPEVTMRRHPLASGRGGGFGGALADHAEPRRRQRTQPRQRDLMTAPLAGAEPACRQPSPRRIDLAEQTPLRSIEAR